MSYANPIGKFFQIRPKQNTNVGVARHTKDLRAVRRYSSWMIVEEQSGPFRVSGAVNYDFRFALTASGSGSINLKRSIAFFFRLTSPIGKCKIPGKRQKLSALLIATFSSKN